MLEGLILYFKHGVIQIKDHTFIYNVLCIILVS